MKKILLYIISCIIFFDTIIAAGITVNGTNEVIKTLISPENLQGEIPTILTANITVGITGRFGCKLTGYDDIHVYDWNETEQKVKVVWIVNSLYNTNLTTATIHVRVREWIPPLPVIFFFGISRYGKIDTPGYPWYVPIKIPLDYGYHIGETNITLRIVPNVEIDGAAHCWIFDRRMYGFFNREWSSIYINH